MEEQNEKFRYIIPYQEIIKLAKQQMYFDTTPEWKELTQEIRKKYLTLIKNEIKEKISFDLKDYKITVDGNKISKSKEYSYIHNPLVHNMLSYVPMASYLKQPTWKPYVLCEIDNFRSKIGSTEGVLNEFDEFVFKAGVMSFVRKVKDRVIACFTIPELLKRLELEKRKGGKIYKMIYDTLEKIKGMFMEHTEFVKLDGEIVELSEREFFVNKNLVITDIEDEKLKQKISELKLDDVLPLKQQRPRLYLFIFKEPFNERLLNSIWKYLNVDIYKKLTPISRRLYELFLIAPKKRTVTKWYISTNKLLKLIPIRDTNHYRAIQTLKTNIKHLEKITNIRGKIVGKNVMFYLKEKQTRKKRKKEPLMKKPTYQKPQQEKDKTFEIIKHLLDIGYKPKEIDTFLNNPTFNIINVEKMIIQGKDLPKDELKNRIDELFRSR